MECKHKILAAQKVIKLIATKVAVGGGELCINYIFISVLPDLSAWSFLYLKKQRILFLF